MLRLSIGSCMLMLRLSIGSCMLMLRLSIGSCMLRLKLSFRGRRLAATSSDIQYSRLTLTQHAKP